MQIYKRTIKGCIKNFESQISYLDFYKKKELG